MVLHNIGKGSTNVYPDDLGHGYSRQPMGVRTDPTPNPNALKFTVGVPVGGPATYVAGSETTEDFVNDVLNIEGVTSLFLTADFVTISKTPTNSWDVIAPQATAILESRFDG